MNKPHLYGLSSLLIVLFTGGFGAITPVRAQPGPPVTQRKINEAAAAFERCRIALLETPGLRQPNEPMPGYLHRIVGAMPGETKSAYLKRVAGYVRAMELAADSTAWAATAPTLTRADSTNSSHWSRIAKDVSYLPARLKHVREAWLTAEQRVSPGEEPKLGDEFVTTVQLMLDALAHLRDARP